jgi:hypothetical protein
MMRLTGDSGKVKQLRGLASVPHMTNQMDGTFGIAVQVKDEPLRTRQMMVQEHNHAILARCDSSKAQSSQAKGIDLCQAAEGVIMWCCGNGTLQGIHTVSC